MTTTTRPRNIDDRKYYHGGGLGDPSATCWPTLCTVDLASAESYSERDGNLYEVCPASDACVLDFSDGNDLDDFIADISAALAEGRDTDGYTLSDMLESVGRANEHITDNDDLIEVLLAQLKDAFNPVDIVDSADAYDNNEMIGLLDLSRWGYPDMILTCDGAVVIPGSGKAVMTRIDEDDIDSLY